MRFRVELLPLVALAASSAPLAGCGKKPTGGTTAIEAGSKKPFLLIRRKEDVPVQLGGAIAPPLPPATDASAGGRGAGAPAPAAQMAVAPPAPALTITHDHRPDQACAPLSREEVEKALADLKQAP